MSILQHLNELQSGKRRTPNQANTQTTPISHTPLGAQYAPAGSGQAGGDGKAGAPSPTPGPTNVVISHNSDSQVRPSSAQVPETVRPSSALEAAVGEMARQKAQSATRGFTQANNAMGSSPLLNTMGRVAHPPLQNSADANSAQIGQTVQPSSAIEVPQKVETYEELFNRMHHEKPKTKEEIEAEKRKQKRNMLFGAISDGLSSLANLYFTTQYAPSQNAPKMMETMQARYDKINKEREQMEKDYWEGLMRARKWDEDKAKSDREEMRQERAWANQMIDTEYVRARREIEDRHKDELHALQLEMQKGGLTLQEYNIKQAQLNDEFARKEKELEMQLKDAQVKYYKMGGSRGSSSKSKSSKSTHVILQDRNGKKYYVPKDEWSSVAQIMFGTIYDSKQDDSLMAKTARGEKLSADDIAKKQLLDNFNKRTSSVPTQEAWVKAHWFEYPELREYLVNGGYDEDPEEDDKPDDFYGGSTTKKSKQPW